MPVDNALWILEARDYGHDEPCLQMNAETEALGEYSPRIGEEAPHLKKTGAKSKIHLMGPTQYLSALSKCSTELQTHVSLGARSSISLFRRTGREQIFLFLFTVRMKGSKAIVISNLSN